MNIKILLVAAFALIISSSVMMGALSLEIDKLNQTLTVSGSDSGGGESFGSHNVFWELGTGTGFVAADPGLISGTYVGSSPGLVLPIFDSKVNGIRFGIAFDDQDNHSQDTWVVNGTGAAVSYAGMASETFLDGFIDVTPIPATLEVSLNGNSDLFGGSDMSVSIVPAPEPSAFALLGTSLFLLFGRRRRSGVGSLKK